MDVLVVLTGRKGHGKDAVADIGISKYNCAGKVALADWFKKVLSTEFKIPLNKFYDVVDKDAVLSKPITINERNLRNLVRAIETHGYKGASRLSVSKWMGRQIHSLRDLMVWFGGEVVYKNVSPTFHCDVTVRALKDTPRSDEGANVIFVTDARFYEQSKYFLERFPFVYTVRIQRPNGSNGDDMTEKCNDEFPDNYFFKTIINDGTIEDLTDKVGKVMMSIKRDLSKRLGKTSKK